MAPPNLTDLNKEVGTTMKIPTHIDLGVEDLDRLAKLKDKLVFFWDEQTETRVGHVVLQCFLKRAGLLICFEELFKTFFNTHEDDVKKIRNISDKILGSGFFKKAIDPIVVNKPRKRWISCGKKNIEIFKLDTWDREIPIKAVDEHLSSNFVCILWLNSVVVKEVFDINEQDIETADIVNWITDKSKKTNSNLAKIAYYFIDKNGPVLFREELPAEPGVINNLLYQRLIEMFNQRLADIKKIMGLPQLNTQTTIGVKGAAGTSPVNPKDCMKFIMYCNYKLDELISKKSHRLVKKISKKPNAKKGQANNAVAQTTVANSSKMKLPSVSKPKVDGSKQKKTGSDKNSTGKKGRNKTPTTSLRLEEGKEDKEEAIVTTLLQDFKKQRKKMEKDGNLETETAVNDVEKWTEDKIKSVLKRI